MQKSYLMKSSPPQKKKKKLTILPPTPNQSSEFIKSRPGNGFIIYMNSIVGER